MITDQAMPKMTGTQLAKIVGKEWPGLQVVLATGYAEIAPKDETGLPKLSKPFFERDLAAVLAGINPKRRDSDRVVQFRAP